MAKEISSQDISELCSQTVELYPAFEEKNVAVAVFSSTEYLPMASVVFSSIIEHADPQRNYDLILVCSSLPREEDRARLSFMVREYSNFSLRIVDGSFFIKLLHTGLKQEDFLYNIDGECLRLFVPLVCRNYEKVVCLATDVVVTMDISELFDFELPPPSPLAAPYSSKLSRLQFRCAEEGFKKSIPKPWEYNDVNSWKMPEGVYRTRLGLIPDQPSFNGDVLVLAPSMLTREGFVERALNTLFRDKWRSLSEAVYNKLLLARWTMLPPEYNIYFLDRNTLLAMDAAAFHEYDGIIKKAKVFHFAGSSYKPWKNPSAPYAQVWWVYARQTPFYEELLHKLMQHEANNKMQEKIKLVFSECRKMPSLKRKARLLTTLRLFTFGKIHRRLKEKGETIRKRIEAFETATQ